MGLDQHGDAVSKRSVGSKPFGFDLSDRVKTECLQDWRNHYKLHEWMYCLYRKKGGRKEFCGIRLRLDEHDLDAFEQAMQSKELYGYKLMSSREGRPAGSGDYEYDAYNLELDQAFLAKARQALKNGKAVFYNSTW